MSDSPDKSQGQEQEQGQRVGFGVDRVGQGQGEGEDRVGVFRPLSADRNNNKGLHIPPYRGPTFRSPAGNGGVASSQDSGIYPAPGLGLGRNQLPPAVL